MTVCVAAICSDSAVVAASDRMLTAGDVQFEPQQSKIVPITTSIAALAAGDSASQAEIFRFVLADINQRIHADPANWWFVRDVAELYRNYSGQLRRRRAEIAILEPLGLTSDSFLARQKQLDPGLVNQLASELISFSPPDVAAIIAGVDPSGVHLYVVEGATLSCHDTVGFAAIGAGYWHADSQFMFAGHTRAAPVPETLLLTYSAKKRAEVAPGVGEGTDMFLIGPTLGSYIAVREDVVIRLNMIYEELQAGIAHANQKAERRAREYADELEEDARATAATAQQGTADAEGGAAGVVSETTGTQPSDSISTKDAA